MESGKGSGCIDILLTQVVRVIILGDTKDNHFIIIGNHRLFSIIVGLCLIIKKNDHICDLSSSMESDCELRILI